MGAPRCRRKNVTMSSICESDRSAFPCLPRKKGRICVPSRPQADGRFTTLGRIAGIEVNKKPVDSATKGQSVAIKINSTAPTEASRIFGRHFNADDELVSHISRRTIDVLKEFYRDEMTKDDWRLLVRLKKLFEV